jgi:hypothetical protein
MDEIIYELSVYSQDSSLNIDLLHQNIEKFGTIFNTVKASCSVMGEIKKKQIKMRSGSNAVANKGHKKR